MNGIAFFTVVYPGAEKYLVDFFVSLENQTFKNFDTVIFNDGLNHYPFSRRDLNMEVIECNGTPAKIRERGLHYLKDKYNVIIFGDCDDYFEINRVETAKDLLAKNDIVVNDLTIVNPGKEILFENYLSKRMRNGQHIAFEYILEKNIFGMSNSAINTHILEKVSFDDNVIAVDWFLFSALLFKGHKGVFTSDTVSYYRQHSSNTIGLGQEDDAKILRGLEIKLVHYEKLSQIYPAGKEIYRQFKNVYNRISNSGELQEKYLLKIKNNRIENPLWWERITVEDF